VGAGCRRHYAESGTFTHSRSSNLANPGNHEETSRESVLVQDCEVCCRPWTVRVQKDPNGAITVSAERD
jgi:hypothetical protein